LSGFTFFKNLTGGDKKTRGLLVLERMILVGLLLTSYRWTATEEERTEAG
jgi:hypothetical protein